MLTGHRVNIRPFYEGVTRNQWLSFVAWLKAGVWSGNFLLASHLVTVHCWFKGRKAYMASERLLFAFWACRTALNFALYAYSLRWCHSLCKLSQQPAPSPSSSLQRVKTHWAQSSANLSEWLWAGGGSHPPSLGVWPTFSSHVSVKSSREVSQVFGCLPTFLMTRHKFICLRTWGLRCHDHGSVSTCVKICHLGQDGTFWIEYCSTESVCLVSTNGL